MSDAATSTVKENVYRFQKPVPGVWINLVAPKSGQRFNAKDRYEATFLIPADSDDLKPMKAKMAAVAKEAFGTVQGVEFPISDGDKRATDDAANGKKRDFFRGNVVLATHANVTDGKGNPLYPPGLVVLNDADEFVRYQGDERKLAAPYFDKYSGCLFIPTVSFVAYKVAKRGGGDDKFVTAYINECLSLNTGTRIVTGTDDEARYGKPESFAEYRGKVSATNPAAGMEDDEIPY